MATAYALHLLFVAVWIGGLMFLQLALGLAPGAHLPEPSTRIHLLSAAPERFLWLGWRRPRSCRLPVFG